MIKRNLILFLLFLPLIVKSQSATGSWQIFPSFQTVDKLIETPSKVYCLSSGSLFSYDKENDEMFSYGIDNVLNDSPVHNIYYNKYGKYLAVTYEGGRIDIFKDNGKSATITDLMDADLTIVPVVNDIAFSDGIMIVATNFGLVIFDDDKFRVKKTGIYYKDLSHVAFTNEYLAVYNYTDRKFAVIKIDGNISDYNNFKESDLVTKACYTINGLKDNKFLICSSSGGKYSPYICTVSPEDCSATYGQIYKNHIRGFIDGKDNYYFYDDANLIKYSDDTSYEEIPLPSNLKGHVIALWDNEDKLWAGDINGIAQYDISGNGFTVLHEKMKNTLNSCSKVGNLYASESGKVYASTRCFSYIHREDWPQQQTLAYISVIDDGDIHDVTPTGLSLYSKSGDGYKDGTMRTQNIGNIVEDPEDPDTYYMASYYDGIFKIKDRKQVSVYNEETSLLHKTITGYFNPQSLDFDKRGNLYVTTWYNNNGAIHMLPADARKKETTEPADWMPFFKNENYIGNTDNSIVVCKKSNIIAYTYRWLEGIIFIDTKGTDTPSDDESRLCSIFYDQDGKLLDLKVCLIGCMIEDHNGHIWVGYDKGLFSIPNPSLAMSDNMKINRIKVPRKDGTNYADYLLDGEYILDIDCDNSNRKWIATQTSGVYLVSEDGSEIISHFDTSNSPLPDNKVYAVSCDKKSNAVYFGTLKGLVKYNSTSAPAAADYSEVYAFPNPVRPEYNGWITIKGLMDDSLVKIADASGNVFFQGMSDGGMIIWDGCDSSGQRVKTGVYYVFASQSSEMASSGAVTKILVVN